MLDRVFAPFYEWTVLKQKFYKACLIFVALELFDEKSSFFFLTMYFFLDLFNSFCEKTVRKSNTLDVGKYKKTKVQKKTNNIK